MSTAGVSGLLVISMIALAAPVLAAGVQRARVPDVVIEIVAGIVVGPAVVGFVALAAKIGLQIILGAFLAGIILNIVDRDTASHPLFRTKLDALGYGFLIPVFFVSSGVEFDLTALTHSPSALAKIRFSCSHY